MYINSENVHGYKKKLYHWRNRINWPMLTQKQNLSFVLIDKDEHITNESKKYKKVYKLFQIIKNLRYFAQLL